MDRAVKSIYGDMLEWKSCMVIAVLSSHNIGSHIRLCIEENKIAFISCTDEVDTSSRTGKIVMSLLASIAEFERDIIAERIADNMYELAKEGRWLGGTTPTGFYSKKEHLTVGGRKSTINHLEPVEEEQAVIKKIFRIFTELRSLGTVVEWTKDKKVLTKTGKEHTNLSIKNILKNPVYAIADKEIYEYFNAFDVPIYADTTDFDGICGLMVYNKTEQTKELREDSTAIHPEYVRKSDRREVCDWIISVGQHKGIIKGGEWIKAQGILQDNKNKYNRPNEETHSLLSGLIACPFCGKNMYTHRETGRYTEGKPRFLYKCQTHRADKTACACADIKGNMIDQFVVDAICSMSKEDNKYYLKLLDNKAFLQTKSDNMAVEIKQLDHSIERLQCEIAGQVKNLRLATQATKSLIFEDIEQMTAELKEAELSKQALAEQKNSHTTGVHSIERVKEIIMSFPQLIENLSFQDKMELVHKIVEKVIVTKNNEDEDEAHIFLKGSIEDDYSDFFKKEQYLHHLCE